MERSSSKARMRTVTLVAVMLLAYLAVLGARFESSRQRLASQLTGSLVLFVVKVLREMRSAEAMMVVMAGVLAVGVLIGVAVQASWQRESGQGSGNLG